MYESKHQITLNDYQVANLKAMFEATGYNSKEPIDSPLGALDTGDWLGEIYWKLPDVSSSPNSTPDSMIEYAIGWQPRVVGRD